MWKLIYLLMMNVRIKKIIFCVIILALSVLYLFSGKSSRGRLDDRNVISLKLLLASAIQAATFGGYEVAAVYSLSKYIVKSKGLTKEGVNEPVTTADYRSHCVMYHSLLKAFPDITVISEEISNDCDNVIVPNLKNAISELDDYDINDDIENIKDITVWIDPLDATKEFTENLLQYVTTMVCIAVKGKPIMGVIYKPFEGRMDHRLYWTWKDHGQSRNLQNLPKQPDRSSPVLIVSRSHAGQVKNASKIAFGENIEIISAAGAGYKFLEVAVQNATAYVHTTAIKKWDICAGTAIISALGGKTTSLLREESIGFHFTDSSRLTSGLLATMKGHNWYLDKFSNI